MKKVLLILAEGFEEIEAITVIDVLRRAGAEVCAAGLNNLIVTGAHGIMLKADSLLKDVAKKDFDMLVLPGGGPGTENLSNSQIALGLVKDYYSKQRFIAAICAAPIVLAKAGIIDKHDITSYPGTEDTFPTDQYKTYRVVVSGNIITSRGPSTSMEFSLELVKLLYDIKTYDDVASALLLK